MRTIYKVVLRPEVEKKTVFTTIEYGRHNSCSEEREEVTFVPTGRTEVRIYKIVFPESLFERFREMKSELAALSAKLTRLGHDGFCIMPTEPGESVCWVGPSEKRSAELVAEFVEDGGGDADEYYVEWYEGIGGHYLRGYRDELDGTFTDRDVYLNKPQECGEFTKDLFRKAFPGTNWDERYF